MNVLCVAVNKHEQMHGQMDGWLSAGHVRSSSEPIQSEDKAISLATSTRNRLKGMRRRAAKLLTRIKADSFDYQSPDMKVLGNSAAEDALELQRMASELQSSMSDSSSAGQSCIADLMQSLACLLLSQAMSHAMSHAMMLMHSCVR